MSMETNDSIVLRIKELISYLNISNGKFADKIGVHRGDMSKYLTEKQRVGDKLIMQILFAFPNINKSWLLNGVGGMLDNPNIAENDDVASIDSTNHIGIPYFALESAACGALSGFGSALTKGNSDGSVVIPTLRTKDGDIFIQTRGRSMIDTKNPERSIPEGAMALVRKWTQNFIEWGEIYCIATEGGFVVKRLMPGSSADFVSCVSADSDNYPTYEIPTCDIKSIGRVIAVVSVTTM